MVTELPPPPAPLIERLEASFPLPAELAPYEYLWASEGEPSPEGAPVEPEDPVRLASSESALPHPIKLLLDRLGFSFRPLFGETRREKMPVTESSNGGEAGGVGTDPVPTGDPIPVGGGGGNPGG